MGSDPVRQMHHVRQLQHQRVGPAVLQAVLPAEQFGDRPARGAEHRHRTGGAVERTLRNGGTVARALRALRGKRRRRPGRREQPLDRHRQRRRTVVQRRGREHMARPVRQQHGVARPEPDGLAAVRQQPAAALQHHMEAGALVGGDAGRPGPADPQPVGGGSSDPHRRDRVAHHVHDRRIAAAAHQ